MITISFKYIPPTFYIFLCGMSLSLIKKIQNPKIKISKYMKEKSRKNIKLMRFVYGPELYFHKEVHPSRGV